MAREVEQELKQLDWIVFSDGADDNDDGDPQLALCDGEEGAISDESVERIQEAYDCMQKLMASIREKKTLLAKRSPSCSPGLLGLVDQALERVKAMESGVFADVWEFLADIRDKTDSDARAIGRRAASEFAQLLAMDKEIAALTKVAKKNQKANDDASVSSGKSKAKTKTKSS